VIKNLKVGVLCGGISSERAVSLRSGRAVSGALKRAGISVFRTDPKFSLDFKKALLRMDIAFIALHGQGGEDGSIQKRLEEAEIPYIGSDAKASWLAFNKAEAKRKFKKAGIPTPDWLMVHSKNWRKLETFGTPFFIKPVANGSSIGVFLVEDLAHSAVKITRAHRTYGALLAEKRIDGREFTVGILGTQSLPVIELRPKRVFYDYCAKYTKGMTEYLVPAPIPSSWRRKLQDLAQRTHKALALRDFSRVDMMMDHKGRAYVLEANTIPGFTELSLLPKAAREAGISFKDLCLRLLQMALARKNGKA
jgi:D-alanine-D-alanine ligase